MGIINWPSGSSGASFSTGRYESSIQWNQTHNLSGSPSRVVAHQRTFIIHYVGPSKILHEARLLWTVMCLSVQELVSSVFFCSSDKVTLLWFMFRAADVIFLRLMLAVVTARACKTQIDSKSYKITVLNYYHITIFMYLGIYATLLCISKITMVL